MFEYQKWAEKINSQNINQNKFHVPNQTTEHPE